MVKHHTHTLKQARIHTHMTSYRVKNHHGHLHSAYWGNVKPAYVLDRHI